MKITLRNKKDAAVRRFHPWVFSGAIYNIDGKPKDGDIVKVYSSRDEFLAMGFYASGSIAVRIFSFEEEEVDVNFWTKKLQNAFVHRYSLNLIGSRTTNSYRLIHGEGDGLSGLIIDIYGDTAVIQCHDIGMHKQRRFLAEALKSIYGDALKAVYDKSVETLPKSYANNFENQYLIGDSEAQIVFENNRQFFVDWERGQKTGFFLDQRDNRELLARYAPAKNVLNAFCYSGGFSIYALEAGAKLVHSVDASAKAIEWTDKNVAINKPKDSSFNHESYVADVMDFLKNPPAQYEVMIIDPPAFAKKISKRHNAVQGYKRLNVLAMKAIAKGGILFTFSCSQVIDKKLFYDTIVAAALEVGRSVRVMHHLNQPADHPVNLFHPEGSYLKGLVLKVE